jgi:uncharacterized membrane-anchored protein
LLLLFVVGEGVNPSNNEKLYRLNSNTRLKTPSIKILLSINYTIFIYFFIYFIYLALPTRAGSPQQHMPITVGPFCLTHPVNLLSLWEETGVPGGNPRLSAER